MWILRQSWDAAGRREQLLSASPLAEEAQCPVTVVGQPLVEPFQQSNREILSLDKIPHLPPFPP